MRNTAGYASSEIAFTDSVGVEFVNSDVSPDGRGVHGEGESHTRQTKKSSFTQRPAFAVWGLCLGLKLRSGFSRKLRALVL